MSSAIHDSEDSEANIVFESVGRIGPGLLRYPLSPLTGLCATLPARMDESTEIHDAFGHGSANMDGNMEITGFDDGWDTVNFESSLSLIDFHNGQANVIFTSISGTGWPSGT